VVGKVAAAAPPIRYISITTNDEKAATLTDARSTEKQWHRTGRKKRETGASQKSQTVSSPLFRRFCCKIGSLEKPKFVVVQTLLLSNFP
jgi:hypothetical protein